MTGNTIIHNINISDNNNNNNYLVDYGLDRKNTFTPIAGDEFMLRREDTKDWLKFVVTTWSPIVNSVANGWENTKATTGQDQGHPFWALGQLYNKQGTAITGYIYFNGCALGDTCGSSGSDGVGFGTLINWSDKSGVYGAGYNQASMAKFYWGTSTEVELSL